MKHELYIGRGRKGDSVPACDSHADRACLRLLARRTYAGPTGASRLRWPRQYDLGYFDMELKHELYIGRGRKGDSVPACDSHADRACLRLLARRTYAGPTGASRLRWPRQYDLIMRAWYACTVTESLWASCRRAQE